MKQDKPTVACVWFGGPRRYERYKKLALVWEHSARKVFGDGANIICCEMEMPDLKQPCPVFARGNRKIGPSKTLAWREKIRGWNRIVAETPIGQPVLMTDVDVAFYRNPFPDVLINTFDIGFCAKSTGAVYFSGTYESRLLMESWRDLTEELFENETLYQLLDKKHKGLDQASFAILTEENVPSWLRIAHLPLRFHSTVHKYELPAYLMHYHSKMRATVMGDHPISILPPELRRYNKAWLRMLREATNETD